MTDEQKAEQDKEVPKASTRLRVLKPVIGNPFDINPYVPKVATHSRILKLVVLKLCVRSTRSSQQSTRERVPK